MVDTFPGGQLSLLVLAVDGTARTGMQRLVAQLAKLFDTFFSAQPPSRYCQLLDPTYRHMATAYSLTVLDETASTQDDARRLFKGKPVLIVTGHQTQGRGRSGRTWQTAPRALATSLAIGLEPQERPTFSLEGGLAWIPQLPGATLKWPNDILRGEEKLGGILVESSDGVSVIGCGLNLWWPQPPAGVSAVFAEDPGWEGAVPMAETWAASLLERLQSPWDRAGYRQICSTIGRQITWEPNGQGVAVDVGEDGSLQVDTEEGLVSLYSGEINQVRTA